MEKSQVLAEKFKSRGNGGQIYWHKECRVRMEMEVRRLRGRTESRERFYINRCQLDEGPCLSSIRGKMGEVSHVYHPLSTKESWPISTAHWDFSSGAWGEFPARPFSDLYSPSPIGTSHVSTIQCMGIATHSTIDRMRLSSAPPWEAVNTVRRSAPRRPWGALMASMLAAGQLGML